MFNALSNTLLCDARNAERAAALQTYAFLIGRWQFDATVQLAAGGVHRGAGSIAAGWVLDGRALQDVWVLPGVFHGTTLRIHDAARDGWHILWSDPLHQYYSRQFGRAEGADIVQLGHDDSGAATRWSFRERMADSFTWRGEVSDDDGASYRLVAEFHCRRVVCA